MRKRYIGDYNHAILSSRASGTGNSARSLVYADGILLSNCSATAPRLHAALGHGHARGDRARRRAVRAVLGRLSGQLGRRGGRLRDADAEGVRGARQGAGYTQPAVPALRHRRRPSAPGEASASIGNRAGEFSWWLDVNHLDSHAPAADASRHELFSGARRAPPGTPVTGAVLDAQQREGSPWYVLGTGTAVRTRCRTTLKLKLAYDITPTLRATYTLGLVAERRRPRRRFVPARRCRQRVTAAYAGADQHRRPRATRVTADRLRAHRRRRLDARHARPARQEPHAGRMGLGGGGEPLRLRRATSSNAPQTAAAARRRRRRHHRRRRRHRLEQAGAEGHLAAGGHRRRAHRRLRRRSSDAYKLRLLDLRHRRQLDCGDAGGALLSNVAGQHRAASLWAQDAWRFAPRWKTVLGAARRALARRRRQPLSERDADAVGFASRSETLPVAEGGAVVPGRPTLAAARPRSAARCACRPSASCYRRDLDHQLAVHQRPEPASPRGRGPPS